MVLSVELKPAVGGVHDEVEIYLNRAGLDSLLAQLRFLESGRTDHVHLLAESWGGSQLSDKPLGSGNTVIRSVKILIR